MKILALTLIFTIVFPAYCFANLQEVSSMKQEIMDKITWIMEDGLIEKVEMENLMLTLDEMSIVSPSQVIGYNCFQAILLTIAYL